MSDTIMPPTKAIPPRSLYPQWSVISSTSPASDAPWCCHHPACVRNLRSHSRLATAYITRTFRTVDRCSLTYSRFSNALASSGPDRNP